MSKERAGASSKPSKHNNKANLSITEFMKKQNEVVSSLQNELQNLKAERQKMNFSVMEKNKCFQELEKCLNDRDAEIKKLKSELADVLSENSKILNDFYTVREKFFELESIYDSETQKQAREMESLEEQHSARESKKVDEIRELTHHCDALVRELHEEKQINAKLNLEYSEIVNRMDKNHQEFVRQQKSFENYKNHMEEQRKTQNEKADNDLNALKQQLLDKQEQFDREKEILRRDLIEKDELLNQYIKDKDAIEQEKDRQIQELNYKINQIEKVFGQPTKSVTPMLSTATSPQSVHMDQQLLKSAYNVAITKPHQRQLAPISKASKENSQLTLPPPETANRGRSRKTPRSSYMANTCTSNINANSNMHRDVFNNKEQLRNPSPPSRRQSTLYSSSMDEDNDEDNEMSVPPWVPKKFVPETETDASECFSSPKRIKM